MSKVYGHCVYRAQAASPVDEFAYLYSDASIDLQRCLSGLAIVVDGRHGELAMTATMRGPDVTDTLLAEIAALRYALATAFVQNLRRIICHTDCMPLYEMLTLPRWKSKRADLCAERTGLLVMARCLDEVRVHWINRDQNKQADHLAGICLDEVRQQVAA